jgi:hypothetical protein
MHLVTRYKRMRIRFIQPSIVCIAISLMRRYLSRQSMDLLPPIPDGLRLHVGAGQNILDGYENLDGYDNEQRPEHFQTQVTKFIRAEVLDTVYPPESVSEIRCHHVFEHISILDVDRTLQGWNRILKPGGLVWIEVPDFEGCARQILKLKREDDKEIFYRHIFGSQVGPGEFHSNAFTAKRLIKLLENYGFEVRLAYIKWTRRVPRKPDMYYPSDIPLPDLTVKAIKVSSPKLNAINAEWTHIAYRKQYPNPELENLSSSSGSNDCGQ